jgi:hypothetical protein
MPAANDKPYSQHTCTIAVTTNMTCWHVLCLTLQVCYRPSTTVAQPRMLGPVRFRQHLSPTAGVFTGKQGHDRANVVSALSFTMLNQHVVWLSLPVNWLGMGCACSYTNVEHCYTPAIQHMYSLNAQQLVDTGSQPHHKLHQTLKQHTDHVACAAAASACAAVTPPLCWLQVTGGRMLTCPT